MLWTCKGKIEDFSDNDILPCCEECYIQCINRHIKAKWWKSTFDEEYPWDNEGNYLK